MTEPQTDISTLAGLSPPNLRAPRVASDEGRNLRVFSWSVRQRRRIERILRPRQHRNGGQRIGGEAEGTGCNEEDDNSGRIVIDEGPARERSAGCAPTSGP